MATSPAADRSLIQPNAEHHYRVTAADLPLSCPMPGMYLWNSHPRVYLPVEADGRAKCPYCGATYSLVSAATPASAPGYSAPARLSLPGGSAA